MKRKRKNGNSVLDAELFNLFKDMYPDPEDCKSAVRDAKRMFSYVRQDKLYASNNFFEDDDQ
jgi:hypothetical protein